MTDAITAASPAAEAGLVVAEVMADLLSGEHRGVVVDSPPGAGKTTLVVRAALDLAATGGPVIVIAQTNEQVDDLIDRLAAAAPTLAIGRLSSSRYSPSDRVARHATVAVRARIADLAGSKIIVGTGAKWATVTEGSWPWAIVDEAYQMRSDALLRVACRFERALFVGDPGQLDPFSTVEVDRWSGLTWDPMQSAVAVLLRHNPDLPVHRLPVSWRLPASAAPLVAEAFYPFSGFRSGTGQGDRRLVLAGRPGAGKPGAGRSGGGRPDVGRLDAGWPDAGRLDAGWPDAGRLDAAIGTAAEHGWALYELPTRHTLRTDAEAATVCAALAARMIERGAVATCERVPEGTPVGASRIAIGTAHRDQAAAIRALLPPAAADITVDTANRLQGREFDVTIVLHPLSGRRDATAFHLEAGRLCVLASRHRHACLVVARAGIPELLDAHPSAERVHLNVPVSFPDGWEANQAVLAHLERYRVAG